METAASSARPYTPWIFGGIALLFALSFAVAFEIMAHHGAPFEDVAASAAPSVFLVAIENGGTRTAIGTAFVVNSKGMLATTAQVAAELDARGALARKGSAHAIVIQGGTYQVRQIVAAAASPDWHAGALNDDVALLQLDAGPVPRALKLGNTDEVAQAVRGAQVATFGFPAASTDTAKPIGRLFLTFVDDIHPNALHVGGIAGGARGTPLFSSSGIVVGMVAGDDGWALTATPVRYLVEK